MAAVHLADVRKVFGSHRVIHGIDLEVRDGEFVVFVGPSGCGKSTLLRMIAGLEDISGGEIAIGGKVMNDVEAADRGIAMVFQSYALYPHMTARQNLSFGLRMTGNDRADTERRVQKAAQILKIEELLDRRPKALSGGQRQRVAIGRAIVREPEVFLFDEPLSNLDAELRVQMRVEIAGLHKELGTTMIYVTHDQVEAMTLADRIVVLRAGRIEQAGRPLDLYDDPDNHFVAGFVGSPAMNFLPAKVVGHGDASARVELMQQPEVRVDLPLSHLPPEGAAVALGVRPEHFGPSGEGDAELRLEIDVAEHLGSTSYAYAHIPGGDRLIVERDPEQRDLAAREVVHSISAARCFLFDAEGNRIR